MGPPRPPPPLQVPSCFHGRRDLCTERGAEGRALRGVQAGLLPLGASDSNLGPLSPGRALLDLPPTQALVPPGSAGYSWFLLAVAPPWRDTSSLAPPMQVREEASWGAVGPDSLSAE